jgi:hypothetical protein
VQFSYNFLYPEEPPAGPKGALTGDCHCSRALTLAREGPGCTLGRERPGCTLVRERPDYTLTRERPDYTLGREREPRAGRETRGLLLAPLARPVPAWVRGE